MRLQSKEISTGPSYAVGDDWGTRKCSRIAVPAGPVCVRTRSARSLTTSERPDPPGEPVLEVPAVTHLAHDMAVVRPDAQDSGPSAVPDAVGRELADGECDVLEPLAGQPEA
jgi:hypothetical protein